MSRALELKKLEAELLRVKAAKADMEGHILQREEDIERLRANLKVQDDKVAELELKIEETRKA